MATRCGTVVCMMGGALSSGPSHPRILVQALRCRRCRDLAQATRGRAPEWVVRPGERSCAQSGNLPVGLARARGLGRAHAVLRICMLAKMRSRTLQLFAEEGFGGSFPSMSRMFLGARSLRFRFYFLQTHPSTYAGCRRQFRSCLSALVSRHFLGGLRQAHAMLQMHAR